MTKFIGRQFKLKRTMTDLIRKYIIKYQVRNFEDPEVVILNQKQMDQFLDEVMHNQTVLIIACKTRSEPFIMSNNNV